MTNEEAMETVEAMQHLAEEFTNALSKLTALTTRNDVRGFYEHLTTGIEVPDGSGGMRTLDPDDDRDELIPGTRFTLGEVLDWSFSLSELTAFVHDSPGNQHVSPGFVRRMFGFVSPRSTV